MTLAQFIDKYKDTIDQVILEVFDCDKHKIDDDEREMWVYNDEYLS